MGHSQIRQTGKHNAQGEPAGCGQLGSQPTLVRPHPGGSFPGIMAAFLGSAESPVMSHAFRLSAGSRVLWPLPCDMGLGGPLLGAVLCFVGSFSAPLTSTH